MFNRQPLNRGKFNVSSAHSLGANGIALMVMGAIIVPATKIINARGTASLKMASAADATIVKFNKGNTGLAMIGNADATKVFIARTNISDMVITTHAEQMLSGEEVINLDGLVLRPSDELVINTCDMTVTLNGQNAMQYFSSDSDFISLLSGENIIEYSDSNASRNISFDVIWKDRWL